MDYISKYNSKAYYAGLEFDGANDRFIILGRSVNCRNKYVVEGTNGWVTEISSSSILRNSVYNRYMPSVYNWGILGDEDTEDKAFNTWKGMIRRCYCLDSSFRSRNKSYDFVEVSTEWKYFKNYKEWYHKNSIDGYVLDKDVLCVGGNKVYSPTTCIFIPEEINRIIVDKNCKNRQNGLPTGVGIGRDGKLYRASCKNPYTNKREEVYSSNLYDTHMWYLSRKQIMVEFTLDLPCSDMLSDKNKGVIVDFYKQKMRTCGYEVIGEVK